MDLFDKNFVDSREQLNLHGVRYILVGGIATNLHGYQRYTGDADIRMEGTATNRYNPRQAYNSIAVLILKVLKRFNSFPDGLRSRLTMVPA